MYAQYWGLQLLPFENTPDPRFFYASPEHQEGLARLKYVVEGRKGAGVLTGVFGCGKTLLARSLLRDLPSSRYRVAYIANPLMSELELLHGIAQKLNITGLPDRRSEILKDVLLEAIGRRLQENARDGKDTLVLIDEAHVLQDERVVEELRLLLNFQDEERFFLTLLLMGQPELRELVDRNKPLAQRICMGYHLVPLSEPETAAYVAYRLRVAGAPKPAAVFSVEAMRLLFESSGGIPRRINQLADVAMLEGMSKNAKHIDEPVLQEAMQSLGV